MKGREARRVAKALDALQRLGEERDPLRRLDLVRRAREAIEELEAMHVEATRAAGRTWSEIGELYGMTKQGAQQRFRRPAEESSGKAQDRPPRGSRGS